MKKGDWLYPIFVKNISAQYACQKVLILSNTFTAKNALGEVNL